MLYREGDHVASAPGVVAIRDIAPRAPTHLLVIPERHIESLRDVAEFPPEEAKQMLDFIAKTAAELADEYSVRTAGGPARAGAVPHGGPCGSARNSFSVPGGEPQGARPFLKISESRAR